MSLSLFCHRCSDALQFDKSSAKMRCPGCSSSGTRTSSPRRPAKVKPPLTDAQKALKKQFAPARRTERFGGGHGVLVPEEIDEGTIQERIMRVLFEAGFLVVRINSGGTKIGKSYVRFYRIFGMPPVFEAEGVPDVLAFKGSKALLIEVKDRTGHLRDSQVRFMEMALSKGVRVHVCRDWEGAEQLALNLVEREKCKPTRAQWERLQAIERLAHQTWGEALDTMIEGQGD